MESPKRAMARQVFFVFIADFAVFQGKRSAILCTGNAGQVTAACIMRRAPISG
jgi:hypothetical protein